MLYLHPELTKYFSTSQSLFDQIMSLGGESFRHQNGRLAQRIQLGDKSYFIKQHSGVGWKEIIKNLLQFIGDEKECPAQPARARIAED